MKKGMIVLFAAGLVLAGCSDKNKGGLIVPPAPPVAGMAYYLDCFGHEDSNPAPSLSKTKDPKHLVSEMRKTVLNRLDAIIDYNANYCKNIFKKEVRQRFSSSMPTLNAMPSASPNVAAPSASSNEAQPESFTGTNLQEAGVDEADLIKTDGLRAYSIHGKKLKITRVWPAESFGAEGEIEIKGESKSLFLLEANKVAVLSRLKDQTQVTFIDVSNPAEPKVIKESKYSGALVSERAVNGFLHLVFNAPIMDFNENYWLKDSALPKCDGSDTPENIAVYRSALMRLKGEKKKEIESLDFSKITKVLAPSVGAVAEYYYSADTFGDSVVRVVTLDTKNIQSPEKQTFVLGGVNMVYASSTSLFAADTQWSTTRIHRFDIVKQPVYTGSTSVDGRLINSFAMGEYKNVLRVATDLGNRTQLSTLDSKDVKLGLLGKVEDIGKGEDLYAVRFLGDRGYAVTFKKVDPLFVIDLADPRNPKIAGELKVPGFSQYLHPVEDSQLIGLGKDADDQGSFAWFQGLKLSLFDVKEATSPKELHAVVIGGRGTGSEAAYDHHAFTFDLSQRLLAIPVTVFKETQGGGSFGAFEYSGLQLYKVGAERGFELIGTLKLSGTDFSEVDTPWGRSSYESTIRRSLLIGDASGTMLVTYRNDGVGLHTLDENLTEIDSVQMNEEMR
ncbi:MAG: beta-propeller domain-containing protein [Deltaproteobacteria bacterium]|nr:beta-propeller domain-containing protein [Deltaproteobacteria bacterium]